jgi:hypothetical protein
MSEMPCSFLLCTRVLIRSMTFSVPTPYGSSVTTMPLRRPTDSTRAWRASERAPSGLVRVADAVEPDDHAAGRQVGPRDEPHQVVEGGVRSGDEVAQRLHHLDQVVRRHVGRHPDRDAGRAVDHEVRIAAGSTTGSRSRLS